MALLNKTINFKYNREPYRKTTMSRYCTVSLLFFLFFTGALTAQQYNFDHFTVKNGLSNNVVRAIEQDDLGFIYIGTNNGLNIYDGSTLSRFSIPDQGNYEAVFSIKKMSDKRLWVNYTGNKNLLHIKRGVLSISRLGNAADLNTIYENLYKHPLLCTDAGLFMLENNNAEKLKLGLKGNDALIHWLFPVTDSLLLIGRKGYPLALVNRYNFKKIAESPENVSVNGIQSDAKGNIWLATDSRGLNILDITALKKGTFLFLPLPAGLEYLFGEDIFCITKNEKDSSLLLGTGTRGVYIYKTDGSFTNINASNGLSSNTVRSILVDKDNNWWFGTNMGMDKLSGNDFILYNHSNGIDEGIVYHMQMDSRQRLWFWGKQNIRYINSNGIINTLNYPAGVEKITLNSVVVPTGLWTLVPGFIFFTRSDIPSPAIQQVIATNDMYRRILSIDDTSFLLGGSQKLALFRNGKITELTDSIKDIRSLYKDSHNRIWVGTFASGLYRFACTKKNGAWTLQLMQKIITPNSRYNRYLSIFEDREGLLWTGSRFEGIRLFAIDKDAAKVITTITTKEGLNNNFITNITQSQDGAIWVGTNTGFNKIIKRNKGFQVINASSYYNFNNPITQLLATSENKVWGTSDIGLFQLTNSVEKKFSLPVYFKEIVFPEKKYPLFTKDTSLRLKADETSFSVSFTSPFYNNEQQTKYYYRLISKKNTDWVEVAGNHQINLTALQHGHYKLQVKAVAFNKNGPDNMATLSFTIATPFTESIWFYSLLFILLLLLVYGIYKYRLRQVLNLYKVRDTISRNLHDEIGATLSSINIYSDVARKKAEDTSEIKPLLNRIYQGSQLVMENMNDIVWYVNPKNDAWDDIVLRMREYAVPLLEAKNIEFHFDTDDTLLKQKLTMQQRQHIYFIFKEAINNIAKYAYATIVTTTLSKNDNLMQLTIKDNGRGFNVASKKNGNGLHNMEHRAGLINARLSINSIEKEGTTIDLKLRIT